MWLTIMVVPSALVGIACVVSLMAVAKQSSLPRKSDHVLDEWPP